ncbi:hypothetical protein B0H19DRAFT_1058456 [Mycena capillaripes]|nr:hypothetical protein B0H19DRAFT_1058456 [Mycena capillaripes]
MHRVPWLRIRNSQAAPRRDMFLMETIQLLNKCPWITAYDPSSNSSPSAIRKVSFENPSLSGGFFPPGPVELGVRSPDFLLMWISATSVGTWNLISSGSEFLIRNTVVPNLSLTANQGAGAVTLANGPAGRQFCMLRYPLLGLWNATVICDCKCEFRWESSDWAEHSPKLRWRNDCNIKSGS